MNDAREHAHVNASSSDESSPGESTRAELATPALPRPTLTPDGVFDAWSWCASDVLVWRRPTNARALDTRDEVTADNPPELLFVVHEGVDASFLPREKAHLHLPAYRFDEDVWALAPWAIDDATDLFYERKVRPRDVLWLAASSLRALVWGLHDWVHFHNHGPFDDPPHTELACDLVALAWLRANRLTLGIDEADVARVQRELAELSTVRFRDAGRAPPTTDLHGVFASSYPGR